MNEHDDKWYDALTGADDGREPDSDDAREGRTLRRAILRDEERARAREERAGGGGLQALEARLEREGLLEPREAASPESRRGARPLQPRWLALAASFALVALILPFAWQAWQSDEGPVSGQPGLVRGVEPQIVEVARPRRTAQRLARLLEETGAETRVYRVEEADLELPAGTTGWVLEAVVPLPPEFSQQRALEAEGIRLPADGRVLSVFSRSAP